VIIAAYRGTKYVGPSECLEIFSPLPKPKTQSPIATLLMLFVNARYQVDHEQDVRLSEADVAHTGRECKPTHLLPR